MSEPRTTSGGGRGPLSAESRQPPEGVERTLRVDRSETDACEGDEAPGRPIVYSPPTVELGMRVPLCLLGYRSGGEVDLTVEGPDGAVRSREVLRGVPRSSAGLRLYWSIPPVGPVGSWNVRVDRGDDSDDDVVRVTMPTYPHVVVEGGGPFEREPGITAGSPVGLVLSGFRAGTAEALHVFREIDEEDGSFEYIASLEAQIDGAGVGHAAIPTATGDPHATYCVTYATPSFTLGEICASTAFRLI